MASVITDVGRNASGETLTGADSNALTQIAVGTGPTSPRTDDTDLDNEAYRSSVSNSNATIEHDTSTYEIVATLSVSGGTEVSSGTEITEIGVFFEDGTMLYREVNEGVVVESGRTVTFEVRIGIIDA